MASSRWWSKDTVAVVTGSNKGIGLEIVRQLAKEGITAVLTARNEQRGLAAVEMLKGEGLSVQFHPLDVSSTDSVSSLAAWLKQQFNGLDILINNAAIADYELNYESSKEVMETNYEGVKRVTRGLLPILRASHAGSRIINVSSGLGRLEGLKSASLREEVSNLEDLTEEKVDAFVQCYLKDVKAGLLEEKGWPTQIYPAYCVSKVALNAHTRVLSKSLENLPNGQKVYINCMTPGFVKTDINKNTGTRTTEQGADCAVWLALLPPGGPLGQFFYERQVIQF